METPKSAAVSADEGASRPARALAPWQGALLYLVFGVVWIYVGDALLERWAGDTAELTRWQTVKGWLYVLLTALLAGGLLRRAQRARAESASSAERQRLTHTAVDHTIEGVVVTDAHSRILSVNAAFTRLMGYTEQEVLGQTPRLFKSGRHDLAFYKAMWAQILGTGHWQGEIWNRRKNGEIFPEHMSLSAVRNAAEEITHYVCVFSDISAEKAQHERMEFLANHDPLTGLANRLWLVQQLETAVQQARARGELLAVLQVNLDRFKDVNDSYGHTVGDQVLRHIALQLQSVLRPGDLLGRMAGDEFAVVARHLRQVDEAATVARQLIAAVAVPWRSPEGFEVQGGASVGICLFPEHADTAKALLQGAHAAVYGAKEQGRGAWCFYAEAMTQAARERLALESRLRQALQHGQLVLHYQPQIDIATGRIVGAEALVRWPGAGRTLGVESENAPPTHAKADRLLAPDEGLIAPVRFIPLAEVSGLIVPLGAWVLTEACRQGQAWRAAGLPEITLAVNVSPRQLRQSDLPAAVAQALLQSGFPAAQLELEITESALAENHEHALRILHQLRALGVHLAIDDFGTGYSSLAQLKRYPIQVLKIDQGFVHDIPRNKDDMAISSAIIAMGHSMGLRVLAEGVETAAQLEFLRAHGCDRYQGYLCSRPVSAAEFEALLRAEAGD